MNIDHEFTVPAPAERAWAMLTDLEQVATCMPGAQLTGAEDDVFQGLVKIKVGPVTAQYKGTAQFVEKDDAGHHAVVSAKGKEARGSGTAAATIDLRLRPDGDERTVVTVGTDLKISGKIAQFGAGMIQEVSAKLLGQFTQCLESRISGADAESEAAPAAEPVADLSAPAAPVAQAAPVVTPVRPVTVAGPEPEALNLAGVVGPALVKRLAPVLAGLVVVALLVRWLRD